MRSLDGLYNVLMSKDRDERPPDAQAVVRLAEAILIDLERQRLMAAPLRGPRPTTDEIRRTVALEPAPGPITEIAIDIPASRMGDGTQLLPPVRGAGTSGTSWRTMFTYLALTLSIGLLWFARTPSAIPVDTATLDPSLMNISRPAGPAFNPGERPTTARPVPDRSDATTVGEPSDADTAVRLVRLRTNPSGAAVFDGDTQLGFTPLPVPILPTQQRTFALLRPGYAPASITLNAEHRGDPLVTLIATPQTAER